MITLRLDKQLEKKIESFAKNMRITKSDLIRRSISYYLKNHEKENAWEAGKDLFGKYHSTDINLAEKAKFKVREKINKKYK